MRRLPIPLFIVFIVAAACGDSTSTTTSSLGVATTTAAVTTTTVVTTTTAVATTAATTTTTTPATTTTLPATTTLAPPATDGEFVSVYYQHRGVVVPFAVPVDPGADPATAAVEALLAGPQGHLTSVPELSGVAEGARLLRLATGNGVAEVDLSAEFNSPTGTDGEMSRLSSLTFTLVEFPEIDEVVLYLDGQRVEFFGGHGFDVTPSLTRDTFLVNEGKVGEILIQQPASFLPVTSPIEITGLAHGAGMRQIRLFDNDGIEIAGGEMMIVPTEPNDFGVFAFPISYEIDSLQLGSLMMWDSGPSGSQDNLVERPVWLVP